MKAQPRVVVVTGASAGVGRAAVRAFAKRGADVGLIARGLDGLEGAKRDVEAAGRRALVLPCDVSHPVSVLQAAETVERELGPIDVWVNDAMVSVFSPVDEMTPEEYQRVTEVTYLGTVYGTLAALRHMRPRNRGVIVQVGSALALRSIPLQSAYCAAKHAMRGFTASLRSELLHAKSGVRVVMVHLPAVNTPQFDWVKSRLPNEPQPVPPIYQPEVPARAVVYAATHDVGRELFLGWSTREAVMASRFAAGFADRYLAKHGYDSQQTGEPVSPDRRNNLWRPLPGDHGAHGAFDDRARRHSTQFWFRKHRRALAVTAGAAALGVALGLRRHT